MHAPFGLKVIAPPAAEPVSLDECKARLRVTIADEDADLAAMITQARELCEAGCQRAFVTQTFSLLLDGFPQLYGGYTGGYGHGGYVHNRRHEIRLPRPPLQSVTWITYFDTAGVLQTCDPATYQVATAGEPGRIVPPWGGYWPAAQFGRPESVEVRFVAGYGPASAVPAAAKAAILLTVQALRDNPAADLPPAARRMLDTLEYGEVR